MYLESFVFTLEIILPVFLLLVLGYSLRRSGFMDEGFITVASKMVFNFTLPALVFLAIATADLDMEVHFRLAVFVAAAIAATCLLAILWVRLASIPRPDASAFVQGSFRSNLGIIGIAMAVYAYGDQGKEVGALILAIGVPAYNLLSVVVLSSGQGVKWGDQLVLIARNPLIVAILVAAMVNHLDLEILGPAESFLQSLGDMTLPLALIAVGGTLDLSALRKTNRIALQITTFKLLVFPVLITLAAMLCGFSGTELGVTALMFASPTAAAAFVMAKSMGGNHVLTANAIAVTTLGSLVSIGMIIYVLRLMSLV